MGPGLPLSAKQHTRACKVTREHNPQVTLVSAAAVGMVLVVFVFANDTSPWHDLFSRGTWHVIGNFSAAFGFFAVSDVIAQALPLVKSNRRMGRSVDDRLHVNFARAVRCGALGRTSHPCAMPHQRMRAALWRCTLLNAGRCTAVIGRALGSLRVMFATQHTRCSSLRCTTTNTPVCACVNFARHLHKRPGLLRVVARAEQDDSAERGGALQLACLRLPRWQILA